VSERWPDKTVIGLTGNIATGKSVVRRMLEHLGAFSIDADSLAHRAMSPGAPAYKPVIEAFGRWILDGNGRIVRERLGKVVFADPGALSILERITHPIVGQVIDLLIRRAKQEVVVIEAIKLFEAGLAADCDTVWVVDAPTEVRLKRLMTDREMSEADARQRIEAQPPQADKLARADVIINNGAGYEITFNQVQAMLGHYVQVVDTAPEPTAETVSAVAEPIAADAEAPPAEITVHRGGPKHAEVIAAFINQQTDASLDRTRVLERFGQKAYMMAYRGNQMVGLAGWQVENLIARIDEFLLQSIPSSNVVIERLMGKIEEAANDLQSEIVLLFLPADVSDATQQAVVGQGYEIVKAADLRIPDWREAAEESAPPNSIMAFKRLREDRVLKPI